MRKTIEIIVMILFCYSVSFSIRIFVELSDDLVSSIGYERSIERWAKEDYLKLKKIWGFDLSFPIYITVEKPSEKWGGESFLSLNSYNVILSSSPERIRRTLTHEMMHLFNFEWNLQNNAKTPLWVVEGIACWWESKNHGKRREVTPLIALNRKMLDVINVKKYPQGDKLFVFYSAVEDLFFRIDNVVDLKRNLLNLFNDAKISGWHEALSSALKTDFLVFYKRWKLEIFFVALLKLLYYNIPWFIALSLMAFLLVARSKLRKNFTDDLSELEKIYGKNYWMDKNNVIK